MKGKCQIRKGYHEQDDANDQFLCKICKISDSGFATQIVAMWGEGLGVTITLLHFKASEPMV